MTDLSFVLDLTLKKSILSRYSSLFSKTKISKTTFLSLTQTGACVGSLHYGLLVQHWALRQWQISSHPCNRDPTEEASYHITSTTVPFQRMRRTCTLSQLKINRHHHVSYRPWNVIGRIPPRALQLSHSVTVHWAAAAENSQTAVPTCHQICALGSQTRLSASCLLPRRQMGGRKSGETLGVTSVMKYTLSYFFFSVTWFFEC